jgi:hypothetical protein
MTQTTEFKTGLEILTPFLVQHNFTLEKFIDKKDFREQFTIVSFKNEGKQFIIDYRFSIGQVLYQYDNSIISHPFYLDQLGFADKKKHKDFLSENKLTEFKYILHDLNYLIDDFFTGKCVKLKEFSILQDNIMRELDRKIRNETSIKNDTIRIDKARQRFRNKELQKCLDTYKVVENNNLLAELDDKIIEYCNRNI